MNINSNGLEKYRDIFKYYVSASVKSEECHDDIGMMVYPNRKNTRNGKQANITDVIEDIRTQSQRQKVSHKKLLPVGYFSVSGFNGCKEDVNVKAHTGLVIIDIDKKDNPDTDFIALKKNLQNNRHTYACFTSPSGGIKLVLNTDIHDIDNHDIYYYAITKYLLKTYSKIMKLDTSGSNVARACFLPYDPNAYYNPSAYKYCLSPVMIDELKEELRALKPNRDSLKVLLEVESMSFDQHYHNILKLIKNRTSMGLEDAKKRSSMGMEGESQTSVGLEGEKRSSVGLYDNIFNNYRFINIRGGLLSTDVPFLELIIWKHIYPYHLDYTTCLDEIYFKDNTQKHLSTDNTNGFEDIEGLDYCEVVLPTDGIGIGFRHKTIASFSMKFIFNNPLCHPDILVRHLQAINEKHCLDPQPYGNPKPTEDEVQNIVLHNYQKYISGKLDFSSVIRKNDRTKAVSKKYVFKSRKYVDICSSYTARRARECFAKGRRDKNIRKYGEAIVALLDGSKITHKRIAKKIGMSERQLRRIRGDEDYQEFFDLQNKLIREYNSSIKY